MSNDRNKILDCKETKILVLVQCDLAGSIRFLAKDGYKYVINFIDDYLGLTMLCFLKHKSDTLLVTTKYLADIAPYDHVKGVSLLSQNCPKTCGFMHWCLQCILEIAVIIKTQEKPHMKVIPIQN